MLFNNLKTDKVICIRNRPAVENKPDAPRSLYSSPGYNNNISQYNLITSVRKKPNVALIIADPFSK
jgi:hypothetical protein